MFIVKGVAGENGVFVFLALLDKQTPEKQLFEPP